MFKTIIIYGAGEVLFSMVGVGVLHTSGMISIGKVVYCDEIALVTTTVGMTVSLEIF